MLGSVRRLARNAFHNALIRARGDLVPMLDIDPEDIRFVQFPELWATRPHKRRSLLLRRLAGDWDRVDAAADVLWSGMYEGQGEASRMIPIERFGFYRACEARFRNGASWESTDWYQWLLARAAAGDRVKRYETPGDIRTRLELLDRMYSEIVRRGYRSAIEDRGLDSGRRLRWFRRPPQWDEPVVNLGRHGRISIEDGRHRLCLARIAGAGTVRVRVGAIHRDLPKTLSAGLSATR
jgi:hypothetical protein